MKNTYNFTFFLQIIIAFDTIKDSQDNEHIKICEKKCNFCIIRISLSSLADENRGYLSIVKWWFLRAAAAGTTALNSLDEIFHISINWGTS